MLPPFQVEPLGPRHVVLRDQTDYDALLTRDPRAVLCYFDEDHDLITVSRTTKSRTSLLTTTRLGCHLHRALRPRAGACPRYRRHRF